jgi:hypothetical protein
MSKKFEDSWLLDEVFPPAVVVIFMTLAIMFTMIISSNIHRGDEMSECKAHGVVVLVDDKAVCKYEKTVEL